MLLTEKDNPQWLNERVTFVKGLAFLHEMAGFHSGIYKTGIATWNIYKRKIYAGCTKARAKL